VGRRRKGTYSWVVGGGEEEEGLTVPSMGLSDDDDVLVLFGFRGADIVGCVAVAIVLEKGGLEAMQLTAFCR